MDTLIDEPMTDGTVYAPSTWCLLHPTGVVEHQLGEPTHVTIRKALRGYTAIAIPLDAGLDDHLHAWRADWTDGSEAANYPARAILAGHLTGPTPLVGPIVLSGVDGKGLPADVLERLAGFSARAAAR